MANSVMVSRPYARPTLLALRSEGLNGNTYVGVIDTSRRKGMRKTTVRV